MDRLPDMQYRFLGRSGLRVSCLSLGGWLTYGAAGGGHVDDDKSIACMKTAYDVGINFFDCAEGYADGESERLIGACIEKHKWKRCDLVISTKINWGQHNGSNAANNVGLSRKHLIEGTNASLERLGLDYVDILYAHRPDRHTPMQEIVRAFNWLIEQGKCFYWGTSEWTAGEIERAHGIAERLNLVGPVVEQPQYNMFSRERVEGEYALLYETLGLGLTPYSPLKAGILTGKYNHTIPADSRFALSNDDFASGMRDKLQTAAWEEECEKVDALRPIAESLNTTLANLALAWVLRNPHVASAITGASRPEQVYDAVKCLDLVDQLTEDVIAKIDAVLGNRPVALVKRF